MTDAFRLEGVAFAYGRTPVLRELTLALPAGAFTALVGPNGSGKTTLLSLLGGLLRPGRGRVLLAGRPVADHRPRELARRVALVPQDTGIDFPFTVREVVAMGRYPHVPRFASPSARDFAAVEAAVEGLGLAALAETPVTQLSGGERQRAVLARALAQ
ncbi:MAG: ABC transporter ATP-binding protein, partial [Deferrisomatales bacterium]